MKALFSERSIEPLSERLAIFIVKWEFYFTGDKIGSRVPLYTLKLLLPIAYPKFSKISDKNETKTMFDHTQWGDRISIWLYTCPCVFFFHLSNASSRFSYFFDFL